MHTKKPFESYNGGKEAEGVYQQIINVMPPHDVYIEALLGNGAVFRFKKPAQHSILIDIDPKVTAAWSKIKVPPGTTIVNTDAISFLQNLSLLAGIFESAGLRVLIYLDPPYPKGSRVSPKNLYKHEFTDADHTRFLTVAGSLPFPTIISSYPNKKYDEHLQTWNNKTFTAKTRQGLAIEKIYFNYAPPSELHDYRYLGYDYRERELVKSRILRQVSKFKRMQAVERNAILELINLNN